jgi:hypothetical protein
VPQRADPPLRRPRQNLTLDERNGRCHTLDAVDRCRDRIVVIELRTNGLKDNVPIYAQYSIDQLSSESIHHRHDDNEGRYAESDPDQRDQRDHRNETFAAPCPQIAKGKHPLESREWARRRCVSRSACFSYRQAGLAFQQSIESAVRRQGNPLPSGAPFEFHFTGGNSPWPNNQLPGKAD